MAKLDIEDVVEIKKLLKFSDLTQQQIADRFDVARTAISKIKNGKQWKDIEIDENGIYISNEIEILPENFPVTFIEEVEEKKNPIQDETTHYRMKFIKEYFKAKVTHGKETHYHYEPASKKSKRFIGALWNSYKWLFNNEWDDFISHVMLSVTETVMTFEPKNKFDWSKVSITGTKENSVIHDIINKVIKTDIFKYANEVNSNFLVEKNGVKEWHKPDVSSIDVVNSNDEGDFPLIEELSNEMNHFHMKDDYFGSHFLDWFSNSHEEILTKEQIRFLNIMKYFQRDKDDKYVMAYSQLPEEYKPYSESARDHHRRRLKERTELAWEQVEQMGLRELSNDKELKFWDSFMKIVNDDENLSEQNEILRKWVKGNIDNDYFEEILINIDSVGILAIRNGEITSKLLYKIVGLIEDRVEELKGRLQ